MNVYYNLTEWPCVEGWAWYNLKALCWWLWVSLDVVRVDSPDVTGLNWDCVSSVPVTSNGVCVVEASGSWGSDADRGN